MSLHLFPAIMCPCPMRSCPSRHSALHSMQIQAVLIKMCRMQNNREENENRYPVKSEWEWERMDEPHERRRQRRNGCVCVYAWWKASGAIVAAVRSSCTIKRDRQRKTEQFHVQFFIHFALHWRRAYCVFLSFFFQVKLTQRKIRDRNEILCLQLNRARDLRVFYAWPHTQTTVCTEYGSVYSNDHSAHRIASNVESNLDSNRRRQVALR